MLRAIFSAGIGGNDGSSAGCNSRGAERAVMTPGRYTELFFLDEATALAAGHRPCAECMRERYEQFRQTWAVANPAVVQDGHLPATLLDATLHRERITASDAKLTYAARLGDLPDGVFVVVDGETDPCLVMRRSLVAWHAGGYGAHRRMAAGTCVQVLTPRSVAGALAYGYGVDIHPSVL